MFSFGPRHCSLIGQRVLALVCSLVLLSGVALKAQTSSAGWQGVLKDERAQPIKGATVVLEVGKEQRKTTTSADGSYSFTTMPSGSYSLSVDIKGQVFHSIAVIKIPATAAKTTLTLKIDGELTVEEQHEEAAGGGEKLSSKSVSEIPLNKRDFSQLLLLAAGTAADPSGASNFTQQFAINGQRGNEATFAMDGADISDPEQGGGTFTNFNVDAVLEMQSLSGVMPAEVGQGSSGFTNIVTRSGTDGIHGSVFEFIRNSALDARNYFDFSSPANPGRIPPFKRNEFGLTNGGPIYVPHVYDGKGKAYYFVEYQGFRQVLGTTQVFSVPTALQRAGTDVTAYPGDTLTVPVNSAIAAVLAKYPLPNYPGGTFGANTYATSSKVATHADQFSLRLDYQVGKKNHFLGRITFDNLDGPTTNPDQTVLNPTFGVTYGDRQRSGVFTWALTATPKLTFESTIAGIRTTPSFTTPNETDPAIKFNDALFEPFNAPAGSVVKSFTNLFQFRENVTFTTSSHALKVGGEVRLWRDSSYFGTSPNGEYDFGGGTAFSPVNIQSQSGLHNVKIGDPLPDTLSAFLTGSPFAYTRAVAPAYFSNGERIGPAADSRNSYEAYVQDTWKATPHLVLNFGLRFEVYTPLWDRGRRASGFYPTSGGGQEFLVNPDPVSSTWMNNWGPRAQADYAFSSKLRGHVGAGMTTIPQNIWQENYLTGALPFVFYPRVTAAPGRQIPYGFQITPAQIPRAYNTAGTDIFCFGKDQRCARKHCA